MTRNDTNTKGNQMDKLTKTQEISRRIVEAMTTYQMDVKQALDFVCGEGMYAQLVDGLYSELRKGVAR